nr:ABC transporter substrate-binding protein [Tessaracoccus coleopterorum]
MTALLSVTALGLSACAGTTPSGSGSPAATAGGSASATAPAEVVELQYLHRLPDGEGMTAVADIIAKWNAENPNIQVTSTKFDGKAQEMITKLETDVKADNAPVSRSSATARCPRCSSRAWLRTSRPRPTSTATSSAARSTR